jgi:hypothetical protein
METECYERTLISEIADKQPCTLLIPLQIPIIQ